ncbi:class C sortase [Bifidobacterium sp. CP2]|uniref:class C sortase n=1 Tax=Bifidobacterium sp. CP2 TaxID=2809025 RepID=UPI001BDC009C|nr:class C sortase [Bifidobacterium sp. CP2]MBT1181989.1 class C sortase [Bifidobacterium sp. CP2]
MSNDIRTAHEADGTAAARRARHGRIGHTQSKVFSILSVLSLLIGLVIIGAPFVMRAVNEHRQTAVISRSEHTVAAWPYPKAEDELKAARAYNRKLAASGQNVIGEVHDPFTSDTGRSTTSDVDASLAEQDTTYQHLLDTGQGVMGTIRIPSIAVNLPIYHGTGEDALAAGAGHLYGTSLPVGGKGTHAVITGHRGLPNALLFTRLDELKTGDAFYIDVMGEELAYQVDRIDVITPDDSSKLRIRKGEDRVTLMTCTPYGVNSHRLLVSGVRASVPDDVPAADDVHGVNTTTLVLALLGVVVAVLLALAAWWVLRRRGRHG